MENKIINYDLEIQKIVDNIYFSGVILELFQIDNNKSNNLFVQIVNVNLQTLDMAVRPIDPRKIMTFNENRPLNVKNPSGNISFKTSFRKGRLWNKLGFMSFPKILNLKNFRDNDRIYLEKYSLPVNFKNFTLFNYGNKHLNVSSEFVDLSKTGLALKIMTKDAENFSTNDQIIFTLINGYSFSHKATGRLVHVTKVINQTDESFFKIGIKFDNKNHYDQITKFIGNQILIQS
jgi:hypothetical protein